MSTVKFLVELSLRHVKAPEMIDRSRVRNLVLTASLAAAVVGGAIAAITTHILEHRSMASTPTSSKTSLPIASTPERAISDYLVAQGHTYAGTCATTSVPADIGTYCSILRQTNEVTRNYLVGPVASEGDIFVLAHGESGWLIVYISVTKALVP